MKEKCDMLLERKFELIQIAKRAERDGLCKHKSGNLSIYDREHGCILITPSGFYRADLTEDDIIITDLNGNIVENINQNKPSIELMLHLYIYEDRQDVNAVVHTHSHYATAFAINGIKIEPVATEAFFYGEKMGLASYAKPGSMDLANRVTIAIRNYDVCLLKNHGVVTVANSLESAYMKAVYVEDVAKLDYLSRTLADTKSILP